MTVGEGTGRDCIVLWTKTGVPSQTCPFQKRAGAVLQYDNCHETGPEASSPPLWEISQSLQIVSGDFSFMKTRDANKHSSYAHASFYSPFTLPENS